MECPQLSFPPHHLSIFCLHNSHFPPYSFPRPASLLRHPSISCRASCPLFPVFLSPFPQTLFPLSCDPLHFPEALSSQGPLIPLVTHFSGDLILFPASFFTTLALWPGGVLCSSTETSQVSKDHFPSCRRIYFLASSPPCWTQFSTPAHLGWLVSLC